MAKDRTGYVGKDKKGRWFARVTVTDDNGKRRNIAKRAKDRRDAKAVLKGILRDLDVEGSRSVDLARLTFNELADFYAAHYCQPAEYVDGKKVSGLRDVARAKSVLPRFRAFFGRRLLKDIKYSDLHSYYTTRLKQHTHYDRPPTIATMNRELGVLRRIFHIGVREGWLQRNPFGMGEPLISPASEKRRERILTLEEERRVLEACETPERRFLRPLLICLLDTGARLSEFLKHLRWGSVCFESRTITLEAMTTKTLKARQVAMTERMFQELSAMREASQKPDGQVFGVTLRQVRFAFVHACKDAGVGYGSPDGVTLHSLRHTAATRLVKGQMPLQMVGRILGHSQPQTTYRYLTANAETAAQAASILEAFQEGGADVSRADPSRASKAAAS
jgi:integrase